jgi:hypothetical protein
MHPHGYAGAEPTPPRANTPPPGGNVHGLGLVDALRIELQPAQLPWLTAEIDILRYCLEDELAHLRARDDEPPEAAKKECRADARVAEQELDRRAYQLQVLAMIAEQLPVSSEAAASVVTRPWHPPAADAAEVHGVREPVVVVGPAALMTVLIRGATRHAAEALSEELRRPSLDVDHYTERGSGWRARELPRVTPATAEKLRAMAEAARAFTDTYLHVLPSRPTASSPSTTRSTPTSTRSRSASAIPCSGPPGGAGRAAGNS